ncbi:AraC family transcriptional regulator [Pseudomonas seleniipraecipitans]|uniref:AraC family transcriptional regulator n=1 Tax=Phytopseudomonas seleniipraecipitans TaxID=640205 RepID=A0ABY5J4W2_9GAMM|nr:AraC family transcriptional regulator [Pseudomonas seleniipraecipitans]UUD63109.1 AraC family transcriptional regulator [Pseudomonas seleniipraecipitans]
MAQVAEALHNAGPSKDQGLFKYDGEVIWSLSNPASYLPTEAMDHLLRTIRLCAAVPAYAELTAPFGVDVTYGPDTFVIYEAHKGQCNMLFDAPIEPATFSQGDLLVLPCLMRHRITDPSHPPCIDIRELLAKQIEPHLVSHEGQPLLTHLMNQRVNYGGGGDLFGLRMIVMFVDKQTSGALISGLPGPVLLKGFADKHRSFLNAIFDEFEVHRVGHSMTQPVAIRLTEALLTIALKEAAFETESSPIFKGLGDPAVARVIAAVLKEPQRDWELQDLVSIAHVCRSALNSRFSASVGMSPGHFVTHVRLTKASEMLTDTSLSIAAIAERSNYGSEAAFNRAFRKWCGLTPGAVREASSSRS